MKETLSLEILGAFSHLPTLLPLEEKFSFSVTIDVAILHNTLGCLRKLKQCRWVTKQSGCSYLGYISTWQGERMPDRAWTCPSAGCSAHILLDTLELG